MRYFVKLTNDHVDSLYTLNCDGPEGAVEVNEFQFQSYQSIMEEQTQEHLTNGEKRKLAYQTELIIDFNNQKMTVDGANSLWSDYMAEGNTEVCNELSSLIATAKSEIRERYPDEL